MIFLIVVIIVLGFLVLVLQTIFNQTIFYPLPDHIWDPCKPHRSLLINNKISAWYFNNYPDNKTVLFCHGNAGNISHRDYVIELCDRYHLNLLIYDYQGFGRSIGVPSQSQICQDGESVYRYLTEEIHLNPDDIIIWGESLGGAVAAYIASRNPCYRLILMSTFSSLDDIVWDQDSGLLCRSLMYLLSKMSDMLSTKHRICNINVPIVIIHSTEDDLIPFSNSISLYNAIPHSQKLLIPIKGGHSTPHIKSDQLAKLFQFCNLDIKPYEEIEDILDMIRQIKDKHSCKRPRT